jgi:hypothetical protein
MGEFMDYMNPRCQIYGCAACGIRITASSKELIRKITVNNLEILKSTSKEIEDHLVIPGKYRNIKGVTKFDANDNQYLQDEIGDNSILNVRALLCKTCKKDIDSKKSPKYSLKNGIGYGHFKGMILYLLIQTGYD